MYTLANNDKEFFMIVDEVRKFDSLQEDNRHLNLIYQQVKEESYVGVEYKVLITSVMQSLIRLLRISCNQITSWVLQHHH